MGVTYIGRKRVECDLIQWDGTKGRCNWCNKELTGRQQRWCSLSCSEAYGRDHWWNVARAAAMERDGYQCVRCGFPGWHQAFDLRADDPDLDRFSSPRRAWMDALACDFNELPESIKQIAINEETRNRVFAWKRPARRLDPRYKLEVNHKERVWGKHGTPGCHHHLDGLETLCHRCHVEETNRQHREHRISRHEERNGQLRIGVSS